MDLRGYLNSLAEPGCSRAYGCYAIGHHTSPEFAAAVQAEYDRAVEFFDIRRGYYRVLRGVMHFTTARGRGATPATWVEWH